MRLLDNYFKHKGRFPTGGLCQEQLDVFKVQEKKYYHNLDLQIACNNDTSILIESFIDSEDVALEYQFQGQLYPMVHYRIDKLLKSSFSRVSEEKIIHFFFHSLRIGKTVLPKEKLFPLYKKALIEVLDLITEENYQVCTLSKATVFLLFGWAEDDDKERITETSFASYKQMLSFLNLSASYSSYPNMRKKRKRFLPFLQDAFLMSRVTAYFQYYFSKIDGENQRFGFTLAGCLILFLLAMDVDAKEMLFKFHLSQLNQKQVWILGSFYKDFTETESHRLLLSDLYDKYPKAWIDKI